MVNQAVICRFTANVTRAPATGLRRVVLPLQSRFQSRSSPLYLLAQQITHRSYATSQSSTAKSVTTTTKPRATRKTAAKTPATKRTTTATKKTATGKQGAARKTSRKSTSGRPKKAAKPKKTTRPRLTAEQKEKRAAKQARVDLKALKEQALKEPPRKGDNAFFAFVVEQSTKGSNATSQVKELAAKFRAFSPAEREHYNHMANQNKADNERAYKAWVESYTPEQIRLANSARSSLRRLLKAPKGSKKVDGVHIIPIKDERQVKKMRSPYLIFSVERIKSGDFKNILLAEASKLVKAEWDALSAGEKQKYVDEYQAGHNRWIAEYEKTYGHAPPTRTSNAKSSATSSA